MKYCFIFTSTEKGDGFYATCPDIPQLVIAGKSISEIEKKIPTAVAVHKASLQENGLALPDPKHFCKVIEIFEDTKCLL